MTKRYLLFLAQRGLSGREEEAMLSLFWPLRQGVASGYIFADYFFSASRAG
jgi:hypothetical protein